MFKRITLTALLALTPALAYSVDVAQIENGITTAVNELQSKLPAIKAFAQKIKSGDISQVKTALTQYLADKNAPLIPSSVFQFISENIQPAQQTVEDVLQFNIPPSVVSRINTISTNLGTDLQNLKAQAAQTLANVKLNALFDKFAVSARNVTRGEAEQVASKVAQQLADAYKKANIDPSALIASAQKLEGTLGSLKNAAQNLEKGGILNTLDDLRKQLQDFFATPANQRGDITDTIAGLAIQLQGQSSTAKDFTDAFADFLSQLIPFAKNLFTTLGPVIWAQIPVQEQQYALQALAKLKANENALVNAVNKVKSVLNNVMQ